MAEEMDADELSGMFDHVGAIAGLVDTAFAGQAAKEVETFEQVTGRRLSDAEVTVLRDTLYGSIRDIVAGVGMSHPNFTKVALELSARGAAKLGIVQH